jgi:hypothetical protein
LKTNQAGRECLAWCTADHAGTGWCEGPEHSGPGYHVQAEMPDSLTSPEIQAIAVSNGKGALVAADSAYRAEKLARFIEIVTVMPRAHARDLAAAVRKTSAEIWPEKEAEAS